VDSAGAYRRYIDKFPRGRFVALAKFKIAAINKDFSFRKFAETFPVAFGRSREINYCNGRAVDSPRTLVKHKNELLYIDLIVPLDNILCRRKLTSGVEVVEYHKSRRNCGTVIQNFGERRYIKPSCETKFLDDGSTDHWMAGFHKWWIGHKRDRMLSISDGDGTMYLSLKSSNYYSFRMTDGEGIVRDTNVEVKGLVRVKATMEEIEPVVFLEPVDPAAIGLT